jgi:ATP-dependent RNA helicase MSS116
MSRRQTLLFSATVPESLHAVKSLALRDDAVFVDCIGDVDVATNVQVRQSYVVVPFENHVGALEALLRQHMAANPEFKIIVFFTTARITDFMAELFRLAGLPVAAMHSRQTQGARTRTADAFRTGTGTIMFSSDVSVGFVFFIATSLFS